jgi:hypothetical protein
MTCVAKRFYSFLSMLALFLSASAFFSANTTHQFFDRLRHGYFRKSTITSLPHLSLANGLGFHVGPALCILAMQFDFFKTMLVMVSTNKLARGPSQPISPRLG